MPIYEYVCSACSRRTEILHGINDPAPHFCPECGAEGSLRKGFAPPAIVFKGSGWAKKDRSSSATRKAEEADGKAGGETRPGETRPGETRPGETRPGETKPAGTSSSSDGDKGGKPAAPTPKPASSSGSSGSSAGGE